MSNTGGADNKGVNDFLDVAEPLYFFDKFASSTEEEINAVFDAEALPMIGNRTLDDCKADLIQAFSGEFEWRKFVTSPPPIVREFQLAIRRLPIKQETFEQMLECWPPVIPKEGPIASLVIFLMRMMNETDKQTAYNIIRWAMSSLCPDDWHKWTSRKSMLKNACAASLVSKKLSFDFWVILMENNEFYIQQMDQDHLVARGSGIVSNVSVDYKKKQVKLLNRDYDLLVKFVPREEAQLKVWETILKKESVPFPLTIKAYEEDDVLPVMMLPAIYNAITADDMLVVRTLTHFTVCKVKDSIPLAHALIDIFAYAGKINQFLVTMVGNEFNNEGLEPSSVLRGNSHLTNLFKAWNDRFGRNFFNVVIKNMIKYVDDHGDIKLTDHDNCDEATAKTMLFTCLKYILSSSEHIPPEMRHMASVLKAISGCRFNSKQASFNTLSACFFLRFITALLAVPESFDKTLKVKSDIAKVMMPFSQVLQTPCNLMCYGGKYPRFDSWNKILQKKIWPELVNFTFALAEFNEVPKYKPPTKEKLNEALRTVMRFMAAAPEKFAKRFDELYNRSELVQPVGWNVGSLMESLFKDNIAD